MLMRRHLPWLLPLAALLIWLGVQVWQWHAGPLVPGYRIERRNLTQDVVATGRVVTPSRISIASEITGLVIGRYVHEGDRVQAGQALLELRSDASAAGIAQAEAGLAQLQQQTRPQAAANLQAARASADMAERDATRLRALQTRNLVSRQSAEQAEANARVAQAQLRAAAAAWQAVRPGGSVERQLQANLALARAQDVRSVLRAGRAGQILTRSVEVGDTVVPGQVLFTEARAGATEILVPVDETNLDLLRLGQPARCATDAYPDRVFTATLSFIAPSVDAARGTVDLRLTVPRPPQWLRQDMTTSVDIRTGAAEAALVIPNDALRARQGTRAQVLLWRDGRARTVSVQLGLRGPFLSQVRSGLRVGDVVLDDNAIAPGARVRVRLRPLPLQASGLHAQSTSNTVAMHP